MKNLPMLIGVSGGIVLAIVLFVFFIWPIQTETTERPDRPFFAVGDEFENIKTIKTDECLDLVEKINTMAPGDQRVELYKLWLDDCIEPDPALPTLP